MRLDKNKSTVRSENRVPAGNPGADRTIFTSDSSTSLYQRGAKRVFDIIAAAIGLCLFSPMLLLVSVAIKLDSRGPIFEAQDRRGYHKETIPILGFRSTGVEDIDGLIPTTGARSVVTRVGRILRRTGIDQLPRLVNVLRGEMSVVGPNPFVAVPGMIFEGQISRISREHRVKPGITGWAQLNGYWGENPDFKAMQRRIEYDLYYIHNCSFLLDMKIILMTLISKNAYGQSGDR